MNQRAHTISRYHPPNHDTSSTEFNSSLSYLGDNSSPTFRRTYVFPIEPINKNLDSSLKCTVFYFPWDHNTCSFAKARRHFLFLEDISGFTTGALAKSCCSTKRRETVFLDKGFPSWMFISWEKSSSSFKSILFNQLYPSTIFSLSRYSWPTCRLSCFRRTIIIVDLRIPWTTLFDLFTISAIAHILRLPFIRSLIISLFSVIFEYFVHFFQSFWSF